MTRGFVIGDIHGQYKQLLDVLRKANFDYENDVLVSLGDIVDRGPEPFLCVFELLKIKNLVAVKGNHDLWTEDWATHKVRTHALNGNGGSNITIMKFIGLSVEEKRDVNSFFESQVLYHVDKENRLFVHAGFDRYNSIHDQNDSDLLISRSFWYSCLSMQHLPKTNTVPCVDSFKEIYIGHTPTTCYDLVNGVIKRADGDYGSITTPINILNVWNMDTGAGFDDGCLTLMNLETKETFQSFIDETKN